MTELKTGQRNYLFSFSYFHIFLFSYLSHYLLINWLITHSEVRESFKIKKFFHFWKFIEIKQHLLYIHDLMWSPKTETWELRFKITFTKDFYLHITQSLLHTIESLTCQMSDSPTDLYVFSYLLSMSLTQCSMHKHCRILTKRKSA